MTLITLILTNVVLAATLVYALVHLLLHGVHSDRRHRASLAVARSAVTVHARDRIAA